MSTTTPTNPSPPTISPVAGAPPRPIRPTAESSPTGIANGRVRPGGTENISLTTKGLAIILIPLLVQILFVIVLWYYQEYVREHRRLAHHSQEVLLTASEAYSAIVLANNQIFLSMFLDKPDYLKDGVAHYERAEIGLTHLSRLVVDNRGQSERATHLYESYLLGRRELEEAAISASRMPPPGAAERDRAVESLHRGFHSIAERILQLRSALDEFLAVENDIANGREKLLERSLSEVFAVLTGGTVIMILVSVILVSLFSQGFARRVGVLLSNLEQIPRGKELSRPLTGSDEIAILDKAIHAMATELQEKEFETELFIYSVSHDLRTPLVNLHGFGDELQLASAKLLETIKSPLDHSQMVTELDRLISGDIAESLKFIKVAVQRMATIIDALLQLSRAGRKAPVQSRQQLQSLVERVIASLSATIAEAKAQLTVDHLPDVTGDAVALEQIFQNLLTNALKYSSPERPLQIHIGSQPFDTSAFVTIFVRDNGLGIADTAQQKLFLAFQRFHPGVASGEGIGLALVRRFTARQGGAVWCESTVGEGSTFFVRLPIALDGEPDVK